MHHAAIHTCAQYWYDIILEFGVELEWDKTKLGTAGCRCCCSWSCAPDEVFGSRLQREIVQQKSHQQDGAQKRCCGGSHLRLWARSSGGAVQLLVV